jgi:hypothetical protein
MEIFKLIESEITSYVGTSIEISPGVNFSQYDLVKKIARFSNKVYEKGNKDSQGNYKYWYDIITPRVDNEIKNIDFDTKDISYYSDIPDDYLAIYLMNLASKQWMRDKQEGVRLNNAIEQFSALGNMVWKRVKGDYDLFNPLNFYVINQAAETLEDTPVIERHILTQSKLRAKAGVWNSDAINETIANCRNKSFSTTKDGAGALIESSTPYYEIYERNGEISIHDLKEAKGEAPKDGDKDRYVLAKIVVSGLGDRDSKGNEGSSKYVLFADEISEMPYIEAHRGKYNGRWWRVGLIETLFDPQVRANEIGNQIAQGLKWSSKTIFRGSDKIFVRNILTDLKNGDFVKSADLSQVETRMNGFDQLIADWNRILQLADSLANSFEVATGESMPSGTPFRLGLIMNQNANKLYGFIREKIALAVQEVYERWVLGDFVKGMKAKDIIRLTGGAKYYEEVCKLAAKGQLVENMKTIALSGGMLYGEEAQQLEEALSQELMKKPELFINYSRDVFTSVKPRVSCVISGENVNKDAELQTLSTFINLEADPVRRTALIEEAMKKSGIDISRLPKSEPQQAQQAPIAPTSQTGNALPLGTGQLPDKQM